MSDITCLSIFFHGGRGLVFSPRQPLKICKPHLFGPEWGHQNLETLVCLVEFLDDLAEDLLGGKAYANIPSQFMARASVKIALWSGVGDTKLAHFVLNLVAKRSRLG